MQKRFHFTNPANVWISLEIISTWSFYLKKKHIKKRTHVWRCFQIEYCYRIKWWISAIEALLFHCHQCYYRYIIINKFQIKLDACYPHGSIHGFFNSSHFHRRAQIKSKILFQTHSVIWTKILWTTVDCMQLKTF